jgi:hypothetical protein
MDGIVLALENALPLLNTHNEAGKELKRDADGVIRDYHNSPTSESAQEKVLRTCNFVVTHLNQNGQQMAAKKITEALNKQRIAS